MNELIERVSVFLKIISDPVRFEILKKLKNSEKTTNEIEQELGISQSYTSQQLKALLDANLLNVQRMGNNTKVYSVKNKNIFKILNSIQSFVLELERDRLDNILNGDKSDTLIH